MKELLNHVHCMDCIEFLKKLPDNSVDSSVTDPPYGLNFMNKKWDSGAVTFDSDVWSEILRVLKPGAHLLAFGGTRTYHRLACAIEDAGFDIIDQIHWLYGSGFPKGQNIGKRIDQIKGAEREIVGRYVHPRSREKGKEKDNSWGEKSLRRTLEGYGTQGDDKRTLDERLDITEAVTDEAKQWQGWNTQLKPAHEPIVLARKPISEKSIVDNVLRHGTGALNIDGCRIGIERPVTINDPLKFKRFKEQDGCARKPSCHPDNRINVGRYPANLILSHHPDCKHIKQGTTVLDSKRYKRNEPVRGKYGIYGYEIRETVDIQDYDSKSKPDVWKCVERCPVRELNEQTADLKSGGSLTGDEPSCKTGTHGIYGQIDRRHVWKSYGDSSGAARFFYCAKPSVNERNAGLEERNIHITVKPLELMRWLVRLVTPRGGVVLDPFLGSGTTAIAAENEGCDWLGCDINEEYCEIARLRIVALGGTQTVLDDFDMSLNHEEEVEVGE